MTSYGSLSLVLQRRAKLQQQIAEETQRKQCGQAARQARARVRAAMATQCEKDKKKGTENLPKKPRKDPAVAGVDDDDDKEEDLEEVLEKGNIDESPNLCMHNFQPCQDMPQWVRTEVQGCQHEKQRKKKTWKKQERMPRNRIQMIRTTRRRDE